MLQNCRIFHLGSLSLTQEPVRSASIEAVREAKAAGAMISFDPNYRASLWESQEAAVKNMINVIPHADFLKVSDEESYLITGEKDYDKASGILLQMGPSIVAITLGEHGVFLASRENSEKIAAFQVTAIDTTGAGDSFWGGFLSCFLEMKKGYQEMLWDDWKKCAVFGNAVAGLCVQKRGGIPAIPWREEVNTFIRNRM